MITNRDLVYSQIEDMEPGEIREFDRFVDVFGDELNDKTVRVYITRESKRNGRIYRTQRKEGVFRVVRIK